ncbi:MAG: hypothetical protein ACPGUD_06395 [Parashewanella sp.]
MTADWAMVAVTVIGMIITVLVAVVGNLFQQLKETKKELNAHKLYVANHCVKDEALKDELEKLNTTVNKGFEHLNQIIEAKLNAKTGRT